MTKMRNVVVESHNNVMYDFSSFSKRINPNILPVKILAPEKITNLRITYGSYDYLEDIDKEKYEIFTLHGVTRAYHRNKRIQKKWRKRYHYTQFLLVYKEEFNSLGFDFDGDVCTIVYKEVHTSE